MTKYRDKLRKKGKSWDKVLYAEIKKFNPSRAELTDVFLGMQRYTEYLARKFINELIRIFNVKQNYNLEIIGARAVYTRANGKKGWGHVLTISDNDNVVAAAKLAEKPRNGYNEKIERLKRMAKDKTIKRRARQLLKEIEA